MIAETSVAKHIFRDLSSNPLEIDQLGIDYIVSKYVDDITFYKQIDFDKKWDKSNFATNRVKDFVKIDKEGVYYTFFIYEQVPVVDDEEVGGVRLRALAKKEDAVKTKADAEQASLVINGENMAEHLEVTGFIKYRNSHGFLNAELWPFLKYYPLMTFVYLGILAVWLLMMKKFED